MVAHKGLSQWASFPTGRKTDQLSLPQPIRSSCWKFSRLQGLCLPATCQPERTSHLPVYLHLIRWTPTRFQCGQHLMPVQAGPSLESSSLSHSRPQRSLPGNRKPSEPAMSTPQTQLNTNPCLSVATAVSRNRLMSA